jgi:hypothetical protein
MIVNKIHLAWRKARGHERRIVGELYRYGPMGYHFRYLKPGVEDAKREGFINYPEFPDTENLDIAYTEGIMEIFSLRLIPVGRTDRSSYLSFWEADNSQFDWFDQLALTQGTLLTDNFEFLGVYSPPKVSSFVTDIAHLTGRRFPKDTFYLYDEIQYRIEDNEHDHSGKCVVLSLRGVEVGYVKKIHNLFFFEAENKGLKPHVTVKAIDQNGVVRAVYVVVKLIPV